MYHLHGWLKKCRQNKKLDLLLILHSAARICALTARIILIQCWMSVPTATCPSSPLTTIITVWCFKAWGIGGNKFRNLAMYVSSFTQNESQQSNLLQVVCHLVSVYFFTGTIKEPHLGQVCNTSQTRSYLHRNQDAYRKHVEKCRFQAIISLVFNLKL